MAHTGDNSPDEELPLPDPSPLYSLGDVLDELNLEGDPEKAAALEERRHAEDDRRHRVIDAIRRYDYERDRQMGDLGRAIGDALAANDIDWRELHALWVNAGLHITIENDRYVIEIGEQLVDEEPEPPDSE